MAFHPLHVALVVLLVDVDQNEVVAATFVHLPVPGATAVRLGFLRHVGVASRTLADSPGAESRSEARDHLLAEFGHLV